jgi:hypothetical protein
MTLPEIEIKENLFEVKVDFEKLDIDLKNVELDLGYTGIEMPVYFKEILEKVISKTPAKCSVRAGYGIFNSEIPTTSSSRIIVNNVLFETGKIVTSQLKYSEKVIVFTCTIGKKMETWAKKNMTEGNPVMGYFIDVVASLIVETAANVLHQHIGSKMLREKFNITNRYSPGYCNWSVAEQQKLFSLLPKEFCGIRLTDSALMIPIKSVSGIIGVGKGVKMQKYLCDKCNAKDCTYRSKRPAHLKR